MFKDYHKMSARLVLACSLAGLQGMSLAFAGTGKVVTNLGGTNYFSRLTVLQPDGKILSVGTAYDGGPADFTLVRYNPDGSMDSGFGSGGKVTTDFGGADYASSLALQTDGKIIVAGWTNRDGTNDFALARYTTSGSLDTGFGTSGKVVTDFSGRDDFGASVTVFGDNTIVVAGGTYAINGVSDFALARYGATGVPISGFGTNGKVMTDFSGGDDFGNGVAVQPADSKIVVVGYTGTGGNYDFALARYDNATGALDSSFGGAGKVTTDFGGSLDQGYGVALQADGKIVAAGHTNQGAGHFSFAVARYGNASGALDPSFDTDGKVTTNFGDATKDHYASSVALMTNGNLAVVGKSNLFGNFDFARVIYQGTDGAVVTSGTTDFGSGDDFGNSVAVNPTDNKLVIAGGAASESALARYNADGSGDMTFGVDSRLINISTRANVGTGDNVMIAGFVLNGTPGGTTHKVVIRAIGPSLSSVISGTLPNPTVTIFDKNGAPIVTNDNYTSNTPADLTELASLGLTPANALESALIRSLDPGSPYTAIVQGVASTTGIGLVEVFDVDQANNSSKLINISTRAQVGTGDNVMIGGFVVSGSIPKRVVIRALGPSMAGPPANVPGTLADPSIQLTTVTGTPIASNDNWGTLSASDKAQLNALGLTPTNGNESALVVTLDPNAAYTPIVQGVGATSGIALVEVYEVVQ